MPITGQLLRRLRRTGLYLLLLSPACALAADTDYHIAHGPLAQALQQWSRQSGDALLFDTRELKDLESPGINGNFPSAVALEKLLQGLPVKLLRTPSGVFVVRRQADAARPSSRPRPRAATTATPGDGTRADVELAPVLVTGSRLPRSSLQSTIAVTVIEREDIQRSGYGSLFDLLRHLPGMNGHPPVDAARDGDSLYLPAGAAATTSLDGMGPRATLFLVNGRRLPRYPMVSLQQGALTDLGGIPLSFVERIELVRGGASAIYGADAIAGVVNIVLREQADGAEALLQTGISNQDDGGQYRLQATTGHADERNRWFLGIDLQQRRHVAGDRRNWHRETSRYPVGLLTHDGYYLPAVLCPPSLLTNDGCWYDSSRPRSLQPASSTAAVYGYWGRDLDNGLHAHAELRASHNHQRFNLGPTAAALRFDNGDLINHVFAEAGNARSASSGIEADFSAGIGRSRAGRDWDVGLSRQRSQATLTTSGAVRSSRLLDALADGFIPGFTVLDPALYADLFPTTRNRGRTDQWLGWWGQHRELGKVRGGRVELATGIDLRHETWSARPDKLLEDGELALGLPTERRRLSRQASAAYAELGLPLVPSLHMDLAARLDRDAGDTAFSPRAGLRWNLSPSWSLQLSSGRGYRAPSLFERRRPPGYFGAVALSSSPTLPACAHPVQDNCMIEVQVMENPALSAETSRNQALGLLWTPAASDFSLSLTHNRIDLHDEILDLRPEDAYWNPDTWQLDGNGRLQGLRLYFDNIGRTISRNWTLHGDYRHATTAGLWRLSLDAIQQQQLRRQRHGSGQWTNLRGYATPATAATATVQWQGRQWDTALQAFYTGSTRAWQPDATCPFEQSGIGHCSNPAQLRWNLHLERPVGTRLNAALDIHNLLNTQPVNYLPGNGGQAVGLDDPLGRYFLLTLQFR